jgi:hypothetical protein
MSYFIVPNSETSCEGDFPDGLSFFFEQLEGYYETSEVSQVSELLEIDLSLFQEMDYALEVRNTPDEAPFWQNIDSVVLTVNTLINKIAENPDYYLFVRHITDKQKPDRQILLSANIKNKARAFDWFEKSYEQEPEMFPPNTGFLKNNEITTELKGLGALLDCYKKSGADKIKLVYL